MNSLESLGKLIQQNESAVDVGSLSATFSPNSINQMLDEKAAEEMSFDPETILMALQRPMELREKLNQQCEMILGSSSPLPPQHKFRIKITAPERGPGSSSGETRFTSLIDRLGNYTIIHSNSGAPRGNVVLQMEPEA
jgi:hypothetical protein